MLNLAYLNDYLLAAEYNFFVRHLL